MAISRAEQILNSMIDGTPYDQYPQSRLEDLLLQLKEVIEEGGGSSGVHYSTTETVIGTWIDGKPLYQKTYSFTSGSSAGWSVVGTPPSNVDYIQIITCMVGGYSGGAKTDTGSCILPYASSSSIAVPHIQTKVEQ